MDLSIIIPCHNLERWITPMLVSLKLQQLQDAEVELIFICDNCSDKTNNIIEDFFNSDTQYARISIGKYCVNSCGLARNYGLEAAQGKYIMFLDGDDWLTDASALYDIVYFLNENPQVQVFRFAYEAPGFHFVGHPAMVWQYAYRREVIGDTRFKEIQPHEDLEFNQEIQAKLKEKIPFYNKTLYHYNYMREGSNIYQLTTKNKIEP